MNRFDSDGLQYLWSANSLDTYLECPYKYYLTYIAGWHSVSNSPHLLFGGWYAEALEKFHHLIARGIDREDALRETVLHTLRVSWGWNSDHQYKNRENLIRTIIWYVEEFNPDPMETVILSDGSPAAELEFAYELHNGIVWRGKIDRLVNYNGKRYVNDQKTTGSSLGPYYFEQFNLSNQMTGYTLVGKAVYDIAVDGVVIDAAQIAVGFSRFTRGFTFRVEAQLEEWYDETLYWIAQARAATKEQRFPRNLTSCSKYGGCVFRGICDKALSLRGQFLKADFEQQEGWRKER